MDISIFKTGQKEQVDVQEVFNIWNLLRARYYSSETSTPVYTEPA